VYAWIWRHLPGNAAVKVLTSLVLIAALVLLLFTVVFPWVDPRLPFNDVTVDESGDDGSVTVGMAAWIGMGD
jgi:hypothetical protein